jgi:uncharacterized protein YutE (UPF0331/DUF86 family)/predicted nucleotidyltransferase
MQQMETAIRQALLKLDVSIQAAYLHGSWGTKFERADSDIDIAILSQNPLDMKNCLSIEQALREQTGETATIDVADLRRTDTVFAAHVIAEGRCFLVVDRLATERFEMLALAKYARLNEERAGILADKAEIIERALIRVKTTYAAHAAILEHNLDAQDVIVLNLQRACEAAIDLAMHVVRIKGVGLPRESRDAFSLLQQNKIITPEMAERLKRMVSFRNIAVHDYRTLDWAIVRTIVEKDILDVAEFSRQMVKAYGISE